MSVNALSGRISFLLKASDGDYSTMGCVNALSGRISFLLKHALKMI